MKNTRVDFNSPIAITRRLCGPGPCPGWTELQFSSPVVRSVGKPFAFKILRTQNYFVTDALATKTVLDGAGNNPQLLGSVAYDTQGGACPDNVTPVQPDPAITAVLHDHANRTAYLGNPMVFATPGHGYSCKAYDAAGNVFHTERPGNPGTPTGHSLVEWIAKRRRKQNRTRRADLVVVIHDLRKPVQIKLVVHVRAVLHVGHVEVAVVIVSAIFLLRLVND